MTNTDTLTATQIATVDAIAVDHIGDPMRRMRARLVQGKLSLAREAGDDSELYLRWAARIAGPLLMVRQ